MILGITGGIGAGKSTVLDYLKERYGAFLIECDDVARKLQQPGEVCYEPMLELLSGNEDLLNADGTFNRKTIAALVFADEDLRMALNRIVHPAVKKRVCEMIDLYMKGFPDDTSCSAQYDHDDASSSGRNNLRSPDEVSDCRQNDHKESSGCDQYNRIPLIVIEAALLLEDHYYEICDEIWYVHADENVRRRRLKQSRGYTDEKITEILSSQRSEESFRECCNLTIDNSSENLQNTFRQIDTAMASRGFQPL